MKQTEISTIVQTNSNSSILHSFTYVWVSLVGLIFVLESISSNDIWCLIEKFIERIIYELMDDEKFIQMYFMIDSSKHQAQLQFRDRVVWKSSDCWNGWVKKNLIESHGKET